MLTRGFCCTIGGKTAPSLLEQARQNAAAFIAVGNCACFGGIPFAAPNPTGANGVRSLVSDVPVINITGCSMNVDSFTATVHSFDPCMACAVHVTDPDRREITRIQIV